MIECQDELLSVFGNEFNKFNITRAQNLESIFHMIFRLIMYATMALLWTFFIHVTLPENL